eukprot:7391514-Prymnesium_polylepis.1
MRHRQQGAVALVLSVAAGERRRGVRAAAQRPAAEGSGGAMSSFWHERGTPRHERREGHFRTPERSDDERNDLRVLWPGHERGGGTDPVPPTFGALQTRLPGHCGGAQLGWLPVALSIGIPRAPRRRAAISNDQNTNQRLLSGDEYILVRHYVVRPPLSLARSRL